PAADAGNTPAGLPVRTTSPGGATNTVRYNHNGDVASTTNADGLTTSYTYDGLGRLTGKTVTSDSYPNGLATTYQYDGENRVTGQTAPGVTARIPAAIHTAVHTTASDPDGNATSQGVADSTGGDATRTATSTYDPHGQLASSTDQNGNTTGYGYDS